MRQTDKVWNKDENRAAVKGSFKYVLTLLPKSALLVPTAHHFELKDKVVVSFAKNVWGSVLHNQQLSWGIPGEEDWVIETSNEELLQLR